MNKRYFLSLLIVVSIRSFCDVERYIVCLEGGATKTALQVVDLHGKEFSLDPNGATTLIATGSNITAVGVEGFAKTIDTLLDTAKINGIPLRDLTDQCLIVAGIAGMTIKSNVNAAIEIFEQRGIKSDRVLISSDAELALQMVTDNGAILIAGTGSCSFGIKDGKRFRVGGLGYRLGDEGSCYDISKQGIKAVLEYEFGYGAETNLTSALRKYFNVPELKSTIMPAIYGGKLTPDSIAAAAPIVLELNNAGDEQAKAIVNDVANKLTQIARTIVNIAHLYDCQLHLLGGLFKDKYADSFIKKICEDPLIQGRRITLVNSADKNSVTLFVKSRVCSSTRPLSVAWKDACDMLKS